MAPTREQLFRGTRAEKDWGRRLEAFRAYLAVMARLQLDDRLRAKVASSDIVQQTLLEAFEKRGSFRGTSNGELGAWLRQILAHNLADAFRAHGRAKRRVDHERSLEQSLGQSSSNLGGFIAARQTSPSRGAVRAEEALRLAAALSELPEAQRDVIELHHLKGLSLKEVADQVRRSPEAVAGLLHRGLKALKELLEA